MILVLYFVNIVNYVDLLKDFIIVKSPLLPGMNPPRSWYVIDST